MLGAMRDLPLSDCHGLVGKGPLLVIAPHPDDETLGCGGLIAECRLRGLDVHVLVLTDGAGSHRGSRTYPTDRLVALRAAEAREALGTLGVSQDRIGFLGLPDGRLDRRTGGANGAVAQVVAYARSHGIGTILSTWLHDPHRDHRAAYRVGKRAAQELGATFLCYPVWGWTIPAHAWLPRTRI